MNLAFWICSAPIQFCWILYSPGRLLAPRTFVACSRRTAHSSYDAVRDRERIDLGYGKVDCPDVIMNFTC